MIPRMKLFAVVGFFWGTIAMLGAQSTPAPQASTTDQARLLDALKDQALVVSVSVRQKDPQSGRVLYTSDYSKVTVQGKEVPVRIEANNALMVLQFTPYRQQDQLVVIMQTQFWVQNKDVAQLQYSSRLYTIPAHMGESFFFYPLGRSTPGSGSNEVEVEVVVKPFSPSAAPLPANAVPASTPGVRP